MLNTYHNPKNIIPKLFLVTLLLCASTLLRAQNSVAIGSTDVKTDAVLWLNGDGGQGLLLPVADKDTFTPDNTTANGEGMMIYDATDNMVYFWTGAAWQAVSGGGGAADNWGTQTAVTDGATITGTGVSGNAIKLIDGTGTDQILVWDGSNWGLEAKLAGTDSQDLSLSVNDLSLTGDPTPAAIDLTPYLDNTDAQVAAEVPFDNAISGLTATQVQAALDEIAADVQAGVGLPVMTDAQIIVSNGATPTASDMTGDATISNMGVVTIANNAIDSTNIADGAIIGADISSTANIDVSKLAGGAFGDILATNGVGAPIWQPAGVSIIGESSTTLYAGTGSGNTGGQSTFIGGLSGASNTAGFNTFLGYQSGQLNTIGTSNVFVGGESGLNNISGANNTFLGYAAGRNINTSGDSLTLIGSGSSVSANGLNNATAIGAGAVVGASNSLVLGSVGTNIQFDGELRPADDPGATGQVLTSQGVGATPIWGSTGAAATLQSAYDGGGDIQMGAGEVLNIRSAGGADFFHLIESTNRVGIGMNAPDYAVDIQSGLGMGASQLLRLATAHTNSPVDLVGQGTGSGSFRIRSAGGAGHLIFQTGALNRMIINSAGDVGIGYPGASIPEKLTIWDGNIAIGADLGIDAYTRYMADNVAENWAVGTENTGNGDFIISNAADLSDPKLFIEVGTGNVGIGTATPTSELHLRGSNNATDGTNGVFLDIQNASNTTDAVSGIRFTGSSIDTYQKTAIMVPYTTGSWGISDMIFALNDVGNNTNVSITDARMVIKSSGEIAMGAMTLLTETNQLNLGIGTNSVGSTNGITFWENSTFGMSLGYDGTGSGAANKISIYNNVSTEIFRFEHGGNAYKAGGGSWTTLSDRRVKKDIRSYNKGLKELLQIKPVYFKYNIKSGYSNTNQVYVGVIAQEIKEVLPFTVKESGKLLDSSPILEYDGSSLTYLSIKAIQEQQTIIESQGVEIEILKEQLSAMKSAKATSSIETTSSDELQTLKAEIAEIKAMLGMKAKKE